LETKDRIGHHRDVVELAPERRADHVPGVVDVHPLAGAVRASGPTSVHEPDRDLVPLEAVDEHPGIDPWMPREERRTEARGEGGRRLLDPDLGAGELGRVAA